MGVSNPVFLCIKTKTVDNVQRWVNKGYEMPYSPEKQIL